MEAPILVTQQFLRTSSLAGLLLPGIDGVWGITSTSPALLLNLTTPVAESGCTVSALVHVPDQDAASTASVPAATAFAPGEEQLPLKLRAIF